MSAPVKDIIDYSVFEQLDIRAGRIVHLEPVAKSKKLVAFTISFGDFERTILSAIQEDRDDWADLTGKQCLCLVNLAPRKMAGMTSQGMILEVGYDDGVHPLPLAIPEWDVPDGARLS